MTRLFLSFVGAVALLGTLIEGALADSYKDDMLRHNLKRSEAGAPHYYRRSELQRRSADSAEYAPSRVACPVDDSGDLTSFVRDATGLSDEETAYVEARQAITSPYIIEYLDRLNLTDFNATDFLKNTNLTIGIAFSGGGYRAMLSGAGFMAAFDDRTPGATDENHVGGLLQSATYMAGLSGGSWLVGSVAINNFPTIVDLQADEDVWDISSSIFNPGGWEVWDTAEYYAELVEDVDSKKDAGFNTSLTDLWGRALAIQLFNYTDGGPNVSFSDVRNLSSFTDHSMPYPLIVADGRPYDTDIVSLNSTVFEFSAYEFGSWDPSLYAFTKIEYLGSNVSNGIPVSTNSCFQGFDNAGFVIGSSATLFNEIILELNTTGLEGVLYDAAEDILSDLSDDYDDIAIYDPNPFFNVNTEISYMYNESDLTIVDGGEDYQNIPLVPLIQPVRGLDVIFAIDNSADTDYNWPAGWAMTATYERQFSSQANGTKFPAVPTRNTFVGNNLTASPTWFGCNASNITGENGGTTVPLIVYMANHPLSYYSNTSTYKMSYDTDELDGMITNGYNIATQGNGTLGTNWSKCLGCALIHREVERRNGTHTDECQQCLTDYCWDGTVLTTNATEETEEPTEVLEAEIAATSSPASGHGSSGQGSSSGGSSNVTTGSSSPSGTSSGGSSSSTGSTSSAVSRFNLLIRTPVFAIAISMAVVLVCM
ncbi:lysophospholipase catalytic domain-containing protein [Limtongia smithiae]|uniref:lysophospholipase catalytic domain-containing protein n=1 Tax=Limtongia smithiae TaxID=1125753 RepID=UPI0034CFE15F